MSLPQQTRLAIPAWPVRRSRRRTGWLGLGVSTTYLSLIVLLPVAAIVWKATGDGWGEFWRAVSSPQAVAALRVTVIVSLVVVAIHAVLGTVVAWVLVRDEFRGKTLLNGLIDLPFALPTIVAGLTLLAVYGPKSPLGTNVAYTRIAIALALLFVTLPFVVRSVQPVLRELDRDMEEAAATLGASPLTIFRRIVLPTIAPALASGSALAFGKAVGEFGSVVLITGNIPFSTEVASVHIFGLIETDEPTRAAAVSVVLLAIALFVLLAIDAIERRGRRHDG